MTSLRPVERSSTSPLCLISSRVLSPGSPQGHHRGRHSVILLLSHHPPRLLPLPPSGGRGRNFEDTSPPSQLQVGGVLSRHWSARQSSRADDWMVGVFQDGYRVPFHNLPPVLLVPKELSSSGLGTVHVLALQEEVNKMLLKGAVELVEQPGPGFYSRLFLVEKMTGGLRPVIDLLSLNNFVTIMKFKMETIASVLGSVCQENWMFSIDLQVSECSHHRGVRLLHYLDDWLVVEESRDLLLCHQDLLLQLCNGLGIMEEVGPRFFDLSSVPWHGYKHYPQVGVSISRSSATLQGGSHVISPPPFSTSVHRAVAAWPYVVAGALSSGGTHLHAAPPVANERPLVTNGQRSSQPNPPVSGLCGGSQVVARRGLMEAGGSSTHFTPIPVVICL